MNKNCYKILKVPQTATLKEIKTAYRKLALIYHPDSNSGGDKDQFIAIADALETLSDPYQRSEHDRRIFGGSSTTTRTTTPTTYTPYSQQPSGKKVDPKHFNEDVWNYYHYGDSMPAAEKIATVNKSNVRKSQQPPRPGPSKMTDKFINDFHKSVTEEVEGKARAKADAKKDGGSKDCVIS